MSTDAPLIAPPAPAEFAVPTVAPPLLVPVKPPLEKTPAAIEAVRVLHVINGEHYSGAERVQDLLARQLPQFGYEVGFACVKPARFPSARETKTAPLVELPMRGRFDVRVVSQLVELIRGGDYKLLHAHTPRSAMVGCLAAKQAGVPLVYHVHSPAGQDSTRRLVNAFNSLAEWHSVRDADRLIAVSPSIREYMIARGFAAERVICVPNGVPYTMGITDRTPPYGTWTLGAIALFRPRKGIEVLLDAIAALRSWGCDVRLRAVGGFETPSYEAATLGHAERLGLAPFIDWVGFSRKINAELAQMDLFILPSLFGEGLPMVLLEAMAAGVPIVASRVEGVPEAVVHRQTGLLVNPGSVSQLASAIRSVIDGEVDYTALGVHGRERHATQFSDVAMARGVANVYSGIFAEI